MASIGAASNDPVSSPPLRVGLVNNMPDSRVEATEQQFQRLLEAALPNERFQFLYYRLPGIRRHAATEARMAERYRPFNAIAADGLDALIVTGAKPSAGPLQDAPYWPDFARLVDLAVDLRLPTLWSCLAAHAAVERLHGIQRRPAPAKQSGLFACELATSHPLLEGIRRVGRVPHSRYYGLDEAELCAHGYQVLTRSREVGPDVFMLAGPPLFLFCQGHLEYDANTLELEYQRDLRAHARGAAARPVPPVGARRPTACRDAEGGADAPEWRPFAAALYRNWIRTGAPAKAACH